MNIAIIHSRLNAKGGTQRKTLATACALQDLGHTITVYAMAYDAGKCYPSLLSKLNVEALANYDDKAQKSKIPFLKFFNYFLYSRNENREARRLAETINSRTEILCPFDRLAYRVAVHYKKNIRAIPSVAVMDDIYTKLWASWRRSQFDTSYKLPLRTKFFYRIIDWYETRKYILPHERIIVLDTRTKKWVKDFFGKEADIVRNGLEMKDFPYTLHAHPTTKEVKLLSTGIFFVHRRYEDIIAAVHLLRNRGINATLSIAGNYSGAYSHYYMRLKKLADFLRVGGSIFFLGNVSDEELHRQYKENNIYISANHLQSWGLAPFEAIASGMLAIISKSTGAAEVLTDHAHALLIPPKSPEKIAEAVSEMIDNPERFSAFSKSGRALVEKEITWKKTAKGFSEVFNKAIANGSINR